MGEAYRPCAGCDSVGDSCRAVGCPAVADPAMEAPSEASETLAAAGDVLPDGRIDHRGHLRDEMVGDGTSTCLDCTSDDGNNSWVTWTIPYDINGKPMPKDWRTMRYADVLALCGVSAWTAAPDAPRVEALVERLVRDPSSVDWMTHRILGAGETHVRAVLWALVEGIRQGALLEDGAQ